MTRASKSQKENLSKKYKTLRIGQLNVSHDETFSERLEKRIIPSIEPLNIDVLNFQEVPDVDLLVNSLKEIGFTFHSSTSDESKDQRVTISRTEIIDSNSLKLYKSDKSFLHSSVFYDDKVISIINTHLSWGEDSLVQRCLQLEQINNFSKSLDESDLTILTGDFNADEDSRPVRFMLGKDASIDDKSFTYWTDSWETAGNTENWATSDQKVNPIIAKIASKFGVIHQELLPKRRIDYILTKGWNYGKIGHPLTFGTFGEEFDKTDLPLSDHYGLFSDIIVD